MLKGRVRFRVIVTVRVRDRVMVRVGKLTKVYERTCGSMES